MGYLSQKKHQTRENIFLYTTAAALTALTAKSFADPGFSFGFFNLFHLYCLAGLLLVYALWVKKYKPALFFGVLLLINYTTLSAAGNIFLSDAFNGRESLTLVFAPNKDFVETAEENKIAAGSLILAHRHIAPYTVINQDNPLTLVRVDFRQAQDSEYPLIFKHLHEFLLKQDNPVILFGEFGVPAWHRLFKQFLDDSGLTIKNHLLFTQGSKFNIFSMPGFYVLGFHEMGISSIKRNGKEIIVKTSFNPAAPKQL